MANSCYNWATITGPKEQLQELKSLLDESIFAYNSALHNGKNPDGAFRANYVLRNLGGKEIEKYLDICDATLDKDDTELIFTALSPWSRTDFFPNLKHARPQLRITFSAQECGCLYNVSNDPAQCGGGDYECDSEWDEYDNNEELLEIASGHYHAKITSLRQLKEIIAEDDEFTFDYYPRKFAKEDAWLREDDDIRVCDHCGKPMKEGFYLNGELACSEECRLALYDGDEAQIEEDFSHIEDGGEFYWTEWETYFESQG